MTVDLVIGNGRVVTPGGVIGGGVAIDGERIVAVGADATLPPARRTIDAREQYVIPGLIDAPCSHGQRGGRLDRGGPGPEHAGGDGRRPARRRDHLRALRRPAERAPGAEHRDDHARGQPLVARGLLLPRHRVDRRPSRRAARGVESRRHVVQAFLQRLQAAPHRGALLARRPVGRRHAAAVAALLRRARGARHLHRPLRGHRRRRRARGRADGGRPHGPRCLE